MMLRCSQGSLRPLLRLAALALFIQTLRIVAHNFGSFTVVHNIPALSKQSVQERMLATDLQGIAVNHSSLSKQPEVPNFPKENIDHEVRIEPKTVYSKLDLLRQTQATRLMDSRQVCRRQGIPPKLRTTSFASLMVDSLHKVLFCAVAKIGSTSWTTFMLSRVGKYNVPYGRHTSLINSNTTNLTYITKYSNSQIKGIFQSYYSFLFARNPWTRLLSAYIDKFANTPDRIYWHKNYGKDIIRKYRKNPTNASLSTGNDVAFPEFLAYVVDRGRAGKGMDIHWKPVYEVCHPCQLQYSFLGHLEDVAEEEQIILEDAFNVTKPLDMPQDNRKKGADSNEQIAAAYRSVPQEHIDYLREYYKLDFEVFGYAKDIPGLS